MSALAIAGLIGTAASVGSQIYKTVADKRRNEELEEMKKREEQGLLGLTDEERQLMEEALMEPVRAQGKEAQARQMALAGADGHRYGGQLQAERQAQADVMAQAAQRAGKQIQAANIEQRKADKLYLDQLIADKAQRQAQTVGAIGQAVAQGAKTYGLAEGGYYGFTESAGEVAPAVKLEQLRAAGLDEDMIATMESMAGTKDGDELIDFIYGKLYGTGE